MKQAFQKGLFFDGRTTEKRKGSFGILANISVGGTRRWLSAVIHFQNRICTVFQSALYQTNATVVHTDDLVLLVDPGWLPGEIDEIRHCVGSRRGKPVFLAFTHSDYDHILGYRAFPGARAIASRALAEHPDPERIIAQIRDFDEGYYIVRDYPLEYPRIDHPVGDDGETLRVGGTTLRFDPAPGHTADGLFIRVEPGGLFIAGDYLSDLEIPFVDHSSLAYERTLQKAGRFIGEDRIQLLIPGHGAVTADPAEMARRLDSSRQYLRRLREAVLRDDPAPELERQIAGYPFPKFLSECHRKNRALILKELSEHEEGRVSSPAGQPDEPAR